MMRILHRIGLGCFFAACAAITAKAAITCDYDKDGLADLGAYDSANGTWHLYLSGDHSTSDRVLGSKEARPVLGDFDGDGTNDVAVYERSSGNWTIVRSSDGQTNTINWGWNEARPVPADYDGDGITDLAVFQTAEANWYIFQSSTLTMLKVQFGWYETVPVPADYDGDGKVDLAVYHKTTGNWYIFESSNQQLRVQNWGWSQARPVPADYDGDGKADIAVYHRAAGNWYVLKSSDNQLLLKNWGFARATPVPADYDGDGATDLAVYDVAAGDWYIRQSGTTNLLKQNWGSDDMAPLPSYRDGGVQGLTILAFGDSITYGTCSQSNGPKTGYPMLLERRAEAGLGGHFVTVNAGQPGEWTKTGAKRIRAWLKIFKPDVTLIMEGTNDTFFKEPFSRTIGNLRSMISNARAYGSAAILGTVPPVIKSSYRDRTNQEKLIEQLNPYVRSLGVSQGVPVAEIWSALTSQPNWKTTLMDQRTANHPNDAGYLIVREAFYETLKLGFSSGLYY